MKDIERELGKQIRDAAKHFSVVVLSGARRTGKTFLLQHSFPRASYHLLEDPDVLARVKQDPRGWLEDVKTPAILDEIQNAPELLPYIRSIVDRSPRKPGQWFLTGSQDFSLMSGVTESMTGRAAVFQLTPFSYRELGSWNLLRGGFPEVVSHPKGMGVWFNSYIQTYLERDVRSLKAVKDLSTFRRFIALLASRHGQVLNKSDLAAPLGLSVPTISEWLSVLQTTGHVLLVPPYFENFGKRLIKSPKVYWMDPGLVCFLLGIETERQLEQSTFIGPVFEGFIASELVKNQMNRGRPREIYFFRDEQGLEVDFLLPAPAGKVMLVEAKWTKTVTPQMAASLLRLKSAIKRRPAEAALVHRASRTGQPIHALAPGVKTMTVEELLR